MGNKALTLGETAAQFHTQTDCTTMYAVGQHSDLASVNWWHQAVTHHCRCVAVAAQDLHKQATLRGQNGVWLSLCVCGYQSSVGNAPEDNACGRKDEYYYSVRRPHKSQNEVVKATLRRQPS